VMGAEEETSSLLAIDSVPKTNPKNDTNKVKKVPFWRWYLGAAYMVAMGICGIVLVAIGSNLTSLADNCGTTATEIGSVFVARGVGAIFGALFSAKLFEWFNGNYVMATALTWLALTLVYLPYIDSVTILHVAFLMFGIGTSITDTGCQIMSRKIHGIDAGPWLGANTVLFGIAGAIVPLIDILTSNIKTQFFSLAMIAACNAIALLFNPFGNYSKEKTKKTVDQKKAALLIGANEGLWEFTLEGLFGTMIFLLIGANVTITAYIESYIDETGVINTNKESIVLMALWIGIAIGRLIGLRNQINIENEFQLFIQLTLFFSAGGVLSLLVIIFSSSGLIFWFCVIGYGFFNGPCVGYAYDLNNRLTITTEKGMSIIMFGLNLGASLVPYFTAELWDFFGPIVLMYSLTATMVFSFPILLLINKMGKKKFLPEENTLFCI